MHWWPGDTRDEIIIGAILTQQTTWKNVELSIKALKRNRQLSIIKIANIPINALENAIHSSGYYRQKAKRLKGMCKQIIQIGGIDKIFSMDIPKLRYFLLSISGIGEETADSIILYAANKPTFVIDTYTKRAMSRIFKMNDIKYDSLKQYFEKHTKRDIELYKDMHAQFVELGKNYCKKNNPVCNKCPISSMCLYTKTN